MVNYQIRNCELKLMRQQMFMVVLRCHHNCIANLSKAVTKHELWQLISKPKKSCENQCSHSNVTEDASMQACDTVRSFTVPVVLKVLDCLTLKIKVLDPSEIQELLAHWDSITSQKNWIFHKQMSKFLHSSIQSVDFNQQADQKLLVADTQILKITG